MFTLISHLKTLNPRQPAGDPGGLTIGRDVSLQGLFQCDGLVRIDGHVQGEVRGASVLITREGVVQGLVVADHVVVLGAVYGDIYAHTIELKAECSVEGEIHHADLYLEEGSWFEGKSRRHHDAMAIAPAARHF